MLSSRASSRLQSASPPATRAHELVALTKISVCSSPARAPLVPEVNPHWSLMVRHRSHGGFSLLMHRIFNLRQSSWRQSCESERAYTCSCWSAVSLRGTHVGGSLDSPVRGRRSQWCPLGPWWADRGWWADRWMVDGVRRVSRVVDAAATRPHITHRRCTPCLPGPTLDIRHPDSRSSHRCCRARHSWLQL